MRVLQSLVIQKRLAAWVYSQLLELKCGFRQVVQSCCFLHAAAA